MSFTLRSHNVLPAEGLKREGTSPTSNWFPLYLSCQSSISPPSPQLWALWSVEHYNPPSPQLLTSSTVRLWAAPQINRSQQDLHWSIVGARGGWGWQRENIGFVAWYYLLRSSLEKTLSFGISCKIYIGSSLGSTMRLSDNLSQCDLRAYGSWCGIAEYIPHKFVSLIHN